MNSKQIILLASILVFLVFGVVLKEMQQPSQLATQDYISLDLSFKSMQVEKVLMGKGQDVTVTLKKEGGDWVLPDLWKARAAQEKVEDLFKVLNKARGELRANDKTLLGDFGIEENQAFHVTLLGQGNRKLLDLRIGHERPDFKHVFLRKADSHAVYIAEAGLFPMLGLFGDLETSRPKVDVWTNLDLVRLDTSKIEKVEVHRIVKGRQIVTAGIVKQKDKAAEWKFVREDLPFVISQEKVTGFISQIGNYRGRKILDPNQPNYGFDQPYLEMAVSAGSQGVVVITVGAEAKEGKARFVRTSVSPVVYEISSYLVDDMNIDDSRFFAGNVFNIDDANIQEIRIDHKGTKKMIKSDDPALNSYLELFKNLRIERLLLLPTEEDQVKSPGLSSIEIFSKEGTSQILDIGNELKTQGEEISNFAAIIRGQKQSFAISKIDYDDFFEGIEKAQEAPKSEETVKPLPDKASEPALTPDDGSKNPSSDV